MRLHNAGGYVKSRTLLLVLSLLGVALRVPLGAVEPIIPPTVAKISPAGMERGNTATFTIEGRSLSDATAVIFDAPGLSGKVTEITDVLEKIAPPRAGEDLGAQVPLGKKQTAKLEITVVKDALPGIHQFRIKTPLGTSNLAAIAVGTLPEIKKREETAMDSGTPPQIVQLPATLLGTIATNGEKHIYQFEGKSDEEIVFRVQASSLGSKLASMLVLSDSSGQVLATSAQNANSRDAELHSKLTQSGKYTISLTDRDLGGGKDYFYRLDGGDLPYITGLFPLGVQVGKSARVSVKGVNLGGVGEVRVAPPASAEGWTTMPLEVDGAIHPVNEVKLAVGNETEIAEQEPNDNITQAQSVSLPVTINGHIDSRGKDGGKPDEDYFRFHATKGEKLSIDVAAARLESPLDSVIEVLDARGNAIPRATIRCLNETTTTLSDRDSRTELIRLISTSGLREGDYLMVGDELDRISFIPDQPDADTLLDTMGGLRVAYLGTSPDVHAVNTPVYKSQILPPDAEFPSNGLPVFHLTWRNDDGGPGYGADSKLDFVAPADGDYFLHLKDVRNMEGPDFAYRLTIRDESPDFRLRAEPANPNIPRGGATPVTVSVDAIRGFEGPIEISVKGLPKGVSASPATIHSGQISTTLVLTAAPDAALDGPPTPIQVVGHAVADGHDLIRIANKDADGDEPLQLASITPSPDVVVTTESREIFLEPGKEVTVTLNVERRNGFKGRVPCSVENLPPGVRVVNVGLNGVLVTEAQSRRTFTLRAEDWAEPVKQPIYVVGMVESNSPTLHPSAPLLLNVAAKNQTASAKGSQTAVSEEPTTSQRSTHQ
jgi:hypothetical protein